MKHHPDALFKKTGRTKYRIDEQVARDIASMNTNQTFDLVVPRSGTSDEIIELYDLEIDGDNLIIPRKHIISYIHQYVEQGGLDFETKTGWSVICCETDGSMPKAHSIWNHHGEKTALILSNSKLLEVHYHMDLLGQKGQLIIYSVDGSRYDIKFFLRIGQDNWKGYLINQLRKVKMGHMLNACIAAVDKASSIFSIATHYCYLEPEKPQRYREIKKKTNNTIATMEQVLDSLK